MDIENPNIDVNSKEYDTMVNNHMTYVFQFKDKSGFDSYVDYKRFLTKEELEENTLPNFQLLKIKLFQSSEPKSSPANHPDFYPYLLEKYFRFFFANTHLEKVFPMRIEYYTLIIDSDTFNKYLYFINDYKLQYCQDFILYLIAKIQQVYFSGVEYHNSETSIKEMNIYNKDKVSLKEILERSEKGEPELQQISFKYSTKGVIALKDPSHLDAIIRGTKMFYENGYLKNWRKQIEQGRFYHSKIEEPNTFRNGLCISLHLFFKDFNVFQYEDSKTKDVEMIAIGRLLDIAGVKFQNNKGENYNPNDPKEDSKDKIALTKFVRAIIVQNKVNFVDKEEKQIEFTIDFNALNNYFGKDFIINFDKSYSDKDYIDIGSIVYKYDIYPLFGPLLHVYTCLLDKLFKNGHQFSLPFYEDIKTKNDYASWKTLIDAINNASGITKFSFSINDEKKVVEFSEKLSMEFMRKALSEFYNENKFEFETDFFECSRFKNEDNNYEFRPTGYLNQPQNRILPKFCKACYGFLKSEIPADREASLDRKIYEIISQLLASTHYNGLGDISEEEMIKRVLYWISL